MKKIFRKTTIYLILIVLLAVALRITRACIESRYSVDVYLYFQMAEDWVFNGADYIRLYENHKIPPLLLWIMASGYNLGTTPEYIGLFVGVLLGSLMPLTAFWIALNLFSKRKDEDILRDAAFDENVLPVNYIYALIAAFLVAIHPFLVRISVSCLREIVYLPFVTLAAAFAISAIYNKSLWKWCFFAALTALANTARREGISFIFIFFMWLLVELIADRKSFVKNIKYYLTASGTVVFTFSGLTFLFLYLLPCNSYTWNPFYINID